jgi:hypothetical protein
MRYISSKGKGKHKQGKSSSSSQAWSDMSAPLFVVIVSFHFIYTTCSFDFIVMFYLIYALFLFVGHSGLSAVTGVDPWGAAQLGAAVGSQVVDGQRDTIAGSRGVGGP